MASGRPRKSDPQVLAIAAQELAPELANWLELDELGARELRDLSQMHWEFDGYRFARALERRWHIEPDFDLVEILENAWGILDSAHARAVKEWVTSNSVTLTLAVGTRVITDEHGAGEITSRDDKLATYCVRPDSELVKFKNGGGYILTPEKVRVA